MSDMIERLWRHDALRVQLQSRIGVVVASAVLLVAGQPATAQESIDFEDPPYTGSAAGTIITGQDGFYIPVPDSQDGLVYTYAGNALGIPGNPTAGGNLQFAGVTGGDTALPVPFARAQRDVTYGAGTGVWTVSFDIAATYIGVLPSAQNIGSFSTQIFPDEATFIALATWTDPATAANWNAGYVWYDSGGSQLNEAVDDPGFQTLLTEHWYRWCTTFSLDTNQIVEVSITDLTTGATVTNHPVGRYLVGGGAGGFDPPSGFRLFGGTNSPDADPGGGNTLAFDNIEIELRPDPPSGGACCFEDQTCEFLTQADCEAGGGTYQGDWTGCTDQGCLTIPEACNEDAGSCNENNGTPGCNIELCCALICAIPGFDSCCKFEWDQFCVDEAAQHFECFEVKVPPGFFLDPAEFFAAIEAKGKVSKGFWDFKPNNVDPGFIGAIDDPLNFKTAPGPIWDSMPLDNVQFQSNLDPFGGVGPNPRGAAGLAFATAPFFGIKNNVLVANTFVDSYDILSGVPVGDNHTAMAINVVSLSGDGVSPTHITVWDKNEENKITLILGPLGDSDKQFVGILVNEMTIGRVNIYNTGEGNDGSAEGISSIEVYVLDEKDTCPWDLDGNGTVGATDLLSLLVQWGGPGSADFDGNGTVGATDLLAMLVNWGPCPE